MKCVLWAVCLLSLSRMGAAQTASPSGVVNAATMQSQPQTFNGIARAFASSLCAPGPGCTVVVPTTYPFNAERGGDSNVATVLPGANQHLIDYRMGAEVHTFGDTSPVGMNLPATSFGANCLSHSQTGEAGCLYINHAITTPGMSLGNPAGSGGGSSVPSGWFNTTGFNLNVNSSAAGITGGVDIFLNKFGIGDVHNYWYVQGEGGFRAASDEMLQGRALHAGEMPGPTYTGTVTASSAYKVTTTPVTGNGSQGVGRMLIDTSTPLATGCITAQGHLGTFPVSTFTLGCGAAALPATHAWGTLAANAYNVPFVSSTGANTLTTSTTLLIDLQGGTGFVVGDLAVFAGDFHETAVVQAAQPALNGQQTVTFALAHTHTAGTVVMQSSFGAGGLEIVANDGDGLRYVLDVLGAVAPNQIAVVVFAGAGSNLVSTYNMSLFRYGLADNSMSNTAGILTIPLYPENVAGGAIASYPLITISGANNPAFNGQATGCRQVSTGYPSRIACSQPASTGQQANQQAGITVTLGDTGYGNSRFVLYPLAQVLDVQDYAMSPPALDGTFRLEPNALPLNPGDTVEEPHDYAAGYVASSVGFGFSNVYAAQFSSIENAGVGGAGVNGSIYAHNNIYVNPCSSYIGCGGMLSPPHGYKISGQNGGGVAADFGGMDYAPWPANSAFLYAGCDPQTANCSNPFYHYAVFRGAGYQPPAASGVGQPYRGLNMDFNPNLGILDIAVPHITASEVPTGAGRMSYACFQPNATTGQPELVAKATPCDQP